MTITSRKHVSTTCDELLNHDGWRERVSSRCSCKSYDGRVFRTFELDCGEGYHITISLSEAVDLSLSTLKMSKPYVTTIFRTTYGKLSPRMTDIADCKSREKFYMQLYQTLDERFPLNDPNA